MGTWPYLKLQYVTKDRDRHGNLRFYFRRPGKPKIRLHGLPGSDEFMAAYRAALSETILRRANPKRVSNGCASAITSRLFSKPWKRIPGGVNGQSSTKFAASQATAAGGLATAPYASLKRAHVRKLRDMKIQTRGRQFPSEKDFRALGVGDQDRSGDRQPGRKGEKLGGGSEGYYTWTEEDVEKFEAHWPIGTRPRLAMAIMLYLGVRRSDAVLIGRKHESRDGQIVTLPSSRAEEGWERRSDAADPAALPGNPRCE